MTDFNRDEFTKWAKMFFEARSKSDIEASEDVEGAVLSDHERTLINEVEAAGNLEYVGFGGNRICFSLPDTDEVILFPRWGPENDTLHNGKECNLNEIEIWSNLVEAGREDEFNFLPIRDSQEDGWWVIKPEITPVVQDSQEVVKAWDNGGKEKLWDNLFGFNSHVNMMDLTKHNACMWDGEFVMFDYGTKPQN